MSPHHTLGLRRRRLESARLTGACAVGVVGQVAVDMPEGYLGGVDQIHQAGAVYSLLLAAATALLVLALQRERRLGYRLAPLTYCVSVGVFAPALVSDPVIAGAVVLWNLTLLATQLFPPPDSGDVRPLPDTPIARWLGSNGPALRHLAVVSLLLGIAVVGYRLSDRLLTTAICLGTGYLTLLLAVPLFRLLLRESRRRTLLVAVPAAASLLFLQAPAAALSLLALFDALLIVLLIAQVPGTLEILWHFYDHPSRLVLFSFATLILIGTLLLTFPGAAAGVAPVAPLDALFTATSASCVTGLIVLDTPHAFSSFGQLVVLALIQVGGLGIMVLSTFATIALGGSLGLRGERALTEMLDLQAAPSAYRLTVFITVSTLAVESVGAVVLAICYGIQGLGPAESVWRGLFHAVSAFCNAGFALQSNSLILFREQPLALLTIATLIVLGGVGFAVLAGLWRQMIVRDRRQLSTQVRVVLGWTAALVLLGASLYAACEWNRTLAGLSLPDKLVNAVFQSVTLRTAGFNSVSFAALAPASLVFMTLFMFVGASPGSTGGGVKTTTLAVLLASIRSSVNGEPTRIFDREVPVEIVYRSLAIVLISALVVLSGLFLLLVFEAQPIPDLAFETVSAFGTVGLSLGATAKLGPMGKLIIIGIMFVGRVGPLTVALLLGTGRRRAPFCGYPKTRLMVG